MDDGLRLDLDGQNVSPETVDAHASLSLALALLDAMVAVSEYEEPSGEAPFYLSLTKMEGGSVHFDFQAVPKVDYQSRGIEAYRLAAKRLPVYLRSYESVPRPLRKPLDRLVQATRNLPANVTARAHLDHETVVLSEIVHAPQVPLVTTSETIRAFIERAGGRKPRVTLRVKNQSAFTADCPRRLLEANDFHIYREADVTGVFNRDPLAVGMPIVAGEVTDIRFALPVLDRVAAFDAWYEAAGRPWKDVENIEEELRNRGRH